MLIKITMKYHLSPNKMDVILKNKNHKITSVGMDVEKSEPSYIS